MDSTSDSTDKSGLLTGGYAVLVRIAQVAGALSFMSGLAIAGAEYYNSKRDKQVEQALTLSRQYNNPPFSAYRENIDRAIGNHSDLINASVSDADKLASAINEIIAKEKIGPDLVFVMDFYDVAAYCIAKRICDGDITYDLFYKRARQLYVTFYQYIQARRNISTAEDFGSGLETFARFAQAGAVTSETATK
jgi:hypothetical protein